jgi:hypothetical protein
MATVAGWAFDRNGKMISKLRQNSAQNKRIDEFRRRREAMLRAERKRHSNDANWAIAQVCRGAAAVGSAACRVQKAAYTELQKRGVVP